MVSFDLVGDMLGLDERRPKENEGIRGTRDM